jgi:hypothetical protein
LVNEKKGTRGTRRIKVEWRDRERQAVHGENKRKNEHLVIRRATSTLCMLVGIQINKD